MFVNPFGQFVIDSCLLNIRWIVSSDAANTKTCQRNKTFTKHSQNIFKTFKTFAKHLQNMDNQCFEDVLRMFCKCFVFDPCFSISGATTYYCDTPRAD